jgi:hypothetical protein
MPTLEDILYRSGDVFLPKSVRVILETYLIGDAQSKFYISIWSFIHFGSGILTAWILANYFPASPIYKTGFWIHTAWEYWQIFIGMTKYYTFRGALDIVVDTLMFMGGMLFFSGVYR